MSRLSISGTIANDLRWEILSANIQPGQAIKQNHIARQYGVSQAPVREALRQLASEDLVAYELNCGVKVPTLDRREAEEIGSLRARLEPDFISPACKNFTASDVEIAEKALVEISDAPDVPTLLRVNEAFHEAIFAPADLPVTIQIVRQLRRRYARYLGNMWQSGGNAQTSWQEHRELLDLIARGKARLARDLMKAHIASTTKAVTKSLARSHAA
jgi:DNA-binding GntR family transcriptional regulator